MEQYNLCKKVFFIIFGVRLTRARMHGIQSTVYISMCIHCSRSRSLCLACLLVLAPSLARRIIIIIIFFRRRSLIYEPQRIKTVYLSFEFFSGLSALSSLSLHFYALALFTHFFCVGCTMRPIGDIYRVGKRFMNRPLCPIVTRPQIIIGERQFNGEWGRGRWHPCVSTFDSWDIIVTDKDAQAHAHALYYILWATRFLVIKLPIYNEKISNFFSVVVRCAKRSDIVEPFKRHSTRRRKRMKILSCVSHWMMSLPTQNLKEAEEEEEEEKKAGTKRSNKSG